ncbi:MAG: DUF6057 family protein [Prevotella sp.]|jgi:hypothetical protein
MRKKWIISGVLLVAVGLVAVLLILSLRQGVQQDAILPGDNPYAAIEAEYDQMQRKGQWQQIVESSRQQPTQSLACQKVALLALWRMGKGSPRQLEACLADSRDVLSSETAALMMSDVYVQLGVVSMAQRAAFEALVTTHNDRTRLRALRRLAECAIITRQQDLARKYLFIIEQEYADSRAWAQSMRPLVTAPTLPGNMQTLREYYENANDEFFL